MPPGQFRAKPYLSCLALAALALPALAAQNEAPPAAGVPAKGLTAKAPGKKKAAAPAPDDDPKTKVKPEKNAYDFNLPGADGKDVPLASYKGQYVVVVNLARKSTYNDQLPLLVKFYDTYKAKGVVVVGIPSNDFGAGEPGTGAEITKAYADAKVDFPVMGFAKVSGDDALPIYGYLTKSKGAPAGGPVHWNYTKFVIDKKGNVVARLGPDVAPDSSEMLSTMDQILEGTYKPKKDKPKPPAGAADDDDDE